MVFKYESPSIPLTKKKEMKHQNQKVPDLMMGKNNFSQEQKEATRICC